MNDGLLGLQIGEFSCLVEKEILHHPARQVRSSCRGHPRAPSSSRRRYVASSCIKKVLSKPVEGGNS